MPSFWDVLRIFWSKERVDAWHNAIFSDPARTEVCQNLLCLSPDAHAYWERAYFALKPIRVSDDKKCLDVQFFWLSSNPDVQGVDILQVLSLSASDQGPNLAKLFDNETCTIIKSGDEISLKTDDPVLWPLPDFRLLEMQWFLHRLTAMSGAAETNDDFHYDESEDDIYTQDDWDMDIEREPDRFQEADLPAQPFGAHNFEHMPTPGGGERHREREEEREHVEGEGREGEEHRS